MISAPACAQTSACFFSAAIIEVDSSGRDVPIAMIVSPITASGTFYAAEEYHQDYYLKNPLRYKFYRYNCGRDQRLEALWGKKS